MVLVDEHLVEDGLIEQPSAVVVQLPVQLVGVAQQVELGLEDGCAGGEAVVAVGEPLAGLFTLGLEPGEPGADRVGGKGGVGCQVEQVLLLPVDSRQLDGELFSEESQAGGGLVEHGL